jgi:hypothetical protein
MLDNQGWSPQHGDFQTRLVYGKLEARHKLSEWYFQHDQEIHDEIMKTYSIMFDWSDEWYAYFR